MKCIEVEEAVARMFGIRKHFAIVPNVSWGLLSHECDLLVVRKSGYAIEVEIKVSRSDLKKDEQKRHGHIEWQNRIKELYFAVPDKLLGSALEFVPINAGIITVGRNNVGVTYAHIERPAVSNKHSRALDHAEMLTLARLGSMRILGLKAKLLKFERS